MRLFIKQMSGGGRIFNVSAQCVPSYACHRTLAVSAFPMNYIYI